MRRNELKDLHKYLSQCATVTLNELDDKKKHKLFKVCCGVNINLISSIFEDFNEFVAKKASEMVDPDYMKFEEAIEGKNANPKRLEVKYADAIKSFEAYQDWLAAYMDEEYDGDVKFHLYDFDDLPSNVSGGYIVAIKDILVNFPDGFE